MSGDTIALLKTIVTRDILQRVHDFALPPRGATPQHLFAGTSTLSKTESEQLKKTLLQSIFIPLSHIPYASYPEDLLSTLLPSPSDESFPVQAIGLIALLDQATRMTLQGVNVRWTNAFFDPLAYRLAKQLVNLPAGLRIDEPQRWVDFNQAYSWEDGMLRTQLAHIPFVHSEDAEARLLAIECSERRRSAVEARYNKVDPARTDVQARAIENDLDGFPRLIRGPCPQPYHAEAGYAEFFWFRCQINRAHLPPLIKFGRYPWRNAAVGRESTEEEAAYMDSIGGFAGLKPDVASAIARDVQQSIWSPLS